MDKNSKSIMRAAEAAGFKVDSIGDDIVSLADARGYDLRFYKTSKGWLFARKNAEGIFWARTSLSYRNSHGVSTVEHEDIEVLAGMGPSAYATAANAIRAEARYR